MSRAHNLLLLVILLDLKLIHFETLNVITEFSLFIALAIYKIAIIIDLMVFFITRATAWRACLIINSLNHGVHHFLKVFPLLFLKFHFLLRKRTYVLIEVRSRVITRIRLKIWMYSLAHQMINLFFELHSIHRLFNS